MKSLLPIFMLFAIPLFADIRSNSGQMKFDAGADQQIDMTLNTNGLGIHTIPSSNLDVSGNGHFSTQLWIGPAAGTGNFNLQGTISHIAQVVTSDTTLGLSSKVLVDTSSDNVSLTLPQASDANGISFSIKKTSPSNQVWIISSDNIENYDNRLLLDEDAFQLPSIEITSNGSEWYVVHRSDLSETVIAGDNLEGWWKLDDSSGTSASDTSLNRNHGTLTGSFTFSDNVTTNERDRALLFDGSDDELTIPQATSINSGNNFSFSLWIKGDTQGSDWRRILSKVTGGAGWELQVQTAGPSVGLRIDTSAGTNQVKTVASVLDNTWHHFAFSISNGSVIIYLDGQEANNTTYNHGTGLGNTDDLDIGHADSGSNFQGQIDDIRFYSKVLSASEIDAIYQQTR